MMNSHLSSLVTSCRLVLLLAGCAGPQLHAPEVVDLSEAWRAQLPHGGSTAAFADWWKAFPNPMLVKLIERYRGRETGSVARERQGLAQLAVLHSGPQRVISQHNVLTENDDLLTAQVDQAQAWFRLCRSLGDGWNADPSPTNQLAAQP